MKEKTINLPELWMTKKLGDLCDILDKKRKPISKQYRISGKYPYYGATGIVDYVNDYIFSEKLILVGEDGAKWGRGEQTAFAVDGKYWVNNHAHVLKPDRNIIIDSWIIYYFNHLDLSDFITGVTVPKLNQNKLVSIKIPVPPIEEQKRIVEILDKAFEGIAQAEANTRRNLINARELFDSYLNQIFIQKKGDWETKTIADISTKIEYGSSSKSAQYENNDSIPVLRMGNIQNGLINWNDLVYTDRKDEIEKYSLQYNDVLFNRTNSDIHVGKSGIYKGERPAIFAGYLIRIHYKKEEINPDFLNFYLNSSIAREYGSSVMSRSINQANINGTKLKSYPIYIPSLPMQNKIVDSLYKLKNQAKKLETIYQRKLEAIAELKQSILEKAFTGQLSQ